MRPVRMPRLGQDMTEGRIVRWLKSEGDAVEEGEPLAVIETDKAEVMYEAPMAGFLVQVVVGPDTTAATGAPIAWIADDPAARPPSPESRPPVPSRVVSGGRGRGAPARRPGRPAPRPGSRRRKPVSPLARRRAAELGVDLAEVEGTGPGGRVTADDVSAAHRRSRAGSGETGGLSRMRRAIAARMIESAAVPQFQLMREIVLERIESTGRGPGITYTDMILWATAQALEHHPAVNSGWTGGDPPSVRVHPQVHLGFAVAVEGGLIVPVIRAAAGFDLAGMASERRRLETAARAGRLRGAETQGGTFTVSNLGGAGVDQFIALVNPPESGILAVGAVKPRPIVSGGRLVAAPTVRLTLSGDHRVFDGLDGARFLETIADRLGSIRPA